MHGLLFIFLTGSSLGFSLTQWTCQVRHDSVGMQQHIKCCSPLCKHSSQPGHLEVAQNLLESLPYSHFQLWHKLSLQAPWTHLTYTQIKPTHSHQQRNSFKTDASKVSSSCTMPLTPGLSRTCWVPRPWPRPTCNEIDLNVEWPYTSLILMLKCMCKFQSILGWLTRDHQANQQPQGKASKLKEHCCWEAWGGDLAHTSFLGIMHMESISTCSCTKMFVHFGDVLFNRAQTSKIHPRSICTQKIF